MKQDKTTTGMVDISHKESTKRVALACATITMSRSAFQILMKKSSPKGDVLETARVAGVMAAKSTPGFIPLCHPLLLSKVNVRFEIDRRKNSVTAFAEVTCHGQTGVEMEALSSACIASLTIYDMLKWADKTMVISDIKLLKKTGGKSGNFTRKP